MNLVLLGRRELHSAKRGAQVTFEIYNSYKLTVLTLTESCVA